MSHLVLYEVLVLVLMLDVLEVLLLLEHHVVVEVLGGGGGGGQGSGRHFKARPHWGPGGRRGRRGRPLGGVCRYEEDLTRHGILGQLVPHWYGTHAGRGDWRDTPG